MNHKIYRNKTKQIPQPKPRNKVTQVDENKENKLTNHLSQKNENTSKIRTFGKDITNILKNTSTERQKNTSIFKKNSNKDTTKQHVFVKKNISHKSVKNIYKPNNILSIEKKSMVRYSLDHSNTNTNNNKNSYIMRNSASIVDKNDLKNQLLTKVKNNGVNINMLAFSQNQDLISYRNKDLNKRKNSGFDNKNSKFHITTNISKEKVNAKEKYVKPFRINCNNHNNINHKQKSNNINNNSQRAIDIQNAITKVNDTSIIIKRKTHTNINGMSNNMIIKENKNIDENKKISHYSSSENIIKNNNNINNNVSNNNELIKLSQINSFRRVDNKSQNIISSIQPTKSKSNIEDIIGKRYFDLSSNKNIQIPSEYINIIYYNLLQEESKGLIPSPKYNYMSTQKEVNEQMRSILIDWIIDVHLKFEFTDETLYMTVLIIDRYLSVKEISRSKLQLLGVVALMISCKHEEIDLPKCDDFIYITDNAYTKEEVFKMENDVLNVLEFNLLYPSPIKFFEILAVGFNFNNKQIMMGKYLMETFLLDIKSIKYKPSIVACACTYIVMKFFKFNNYHEAYNKKYFSNDYSGEHIIKECAKDVCLYVDNITSTSFKSTLNKFSTNKYEKVSLLVMGK